MNDLYDEEMECWVANQNVFFLLAWFLGGFLLTLFLFIPQSIYLFFKFKINR